ncbi:TerC family protein [Pseudofrankia inefficax]|uniref:Integral membrane protein TerC n=1 Tax=Pseudofrankia inefficax (strain DSM 45817 / CECT 9037 / DDB 130130 / EuI1c) TaxID=298654 RepID=E3J5D4_PSEI1|nr:TerC family protein [Pseudofrankia inefficax]ADP81878.1 Integral membrane protein TerC [Pseudofrankia inefficax]
MHVPIWAWAAFVAALVALLAIDLLAHRRAHVIRFREAALWSALWVSLGLGFALVIWAWQGPTAAGQYTAAWLLEKSLSVDNLFVFALIFGYFKVPRQYQHRVLFYGVLGALVLRFAFIAGGMALLNAFHVVIYLFGAFLVYTAIKMVRGSGEVDMDPGQSRAVRLLRRVIPVTDQYEGQRFLLRRRGVLVATPLLAVLVAVETADVLFAFDSVPAALGVTDQTFLVYTANALAILGLRSLFFLLSGALDRFHHLGTGLAVILAFIGTKMLLTDVVHIPIAVSLGAIGVVLTASIIWSLLTPAPEKPAGPESSDEPGDPPAALRDGTEPALDGELAGSPAGDPQPVGHGAGGLVQR